MVEERYCSYEVSNLLQEKGFNQECFAKYAKEACTERYYDDYRERMLSWTIKPGELIIPSIDRDRYEIYGTVISAPTHQMACDWIYVKYGIFITTDIYLDELDSSKYITWKIYVCTDDMKCIQGKNDKITDIHNAFELALKYVLENLI